MRLYEDIIRERSTKGPDYMNALLELEAKRDYGRRQQTLRRDIEELQARIATIRKDFHPMKLEVSEHYTARQVEQLFSSDLSCFF